MATNQETAVIKARMDRIPSALSPELVERISDDRASGAVNPYRCNDDQAIRRIDRAADKGTLMRPAIGLGHDLGHTPFGHAGERFLNDIYHERTGRYFFHNVQSVRVLDALYGRNVSLQTLDGVLCHNGEYEQRVFELSDMGSFEHRDERGPV